MTLVAELLEALVEKVTAVLKNKDILGKTITLKIRYGDFTTITRSISCKTEFFSTQEILSYLPDLLAKSEAGSRPIRLLGVSVSNLVHRSQR